MPSLPGGKPRVFTKDGLSNKQDSVLMEIPGMGHIWNTSMPMGIIDEKEKKGSLVLQELATEFLKKILLRLFFGIPRSKR